MVKISLSVDILQLMITPFARPCQKRNTPYKIASCCLGRLSDSVTDYLVKKGFRRLGVQSAMERATFHYVRSKSRESEEERASVTQFLLEQPLSCSLIIEVDRKELAGIEALLKSLDIPKKCISLPH